MRLPRLTLFSGPNCSLCDVAKSELARVKLTRDFRLETIDIQSPGQEFWKKKYVYWIPALHLEGKEICKGRWDGETLFGLYTRDVVQVIGEEAGDSRPFIPSRACFNCGADHTLKDCPQPRNPDVVRLAQDLFYFYNGKAPSRLHDVQAWEVERLQWVDTFEPGKIKGMRLREAMGHNDGDWLRNISRFGYPKGWTGDVDPRQKMRARILGEDTDSEDEVFYIFGMEEEERLDFERAKPIVETSDSSSAPESGPRRWATYPNTYFASDLLPIYKPPVKDALNTDVEYDMHLWRQELWDQILMTPLPPGKVMTLEAYYQSYFYHVFLYSQHFRPPEPKPPPPPTAEPPPLPPLPDTPPSILPLIEDNLSDDDDMDLSD
ncbi:hypothetical protein C8J56DRAFT_1006926 [Mycena floridula]|nr:hypothetical protein C8J56DRAFT_1006926 [Mycena floridula]